MRTKRDRDGALDQLLRQQAQKAAEGDAAGPCLDAETLSAWADGGLKGYGLAMAEAHLAACARCQATLATLTRLSPSPEAPTRERWWAPHLNVRWLAPFAAGALAVYSCGSRCHPIATRVLAPPRPRRRGRPRTDSLRQRKAGRNGSKRRRLLPLTGGHCARLQTKRAPPTVPKRGLIRRRATSVRLASRPATRMWAGSMPQRPRGTRRPAAAPPAQAAATPTSELETAKVASLARQRFVAREVASSDPSVRWRVGPAGSVQHSADNGATWETLPSDVTTDLLGAASPSPTVCWVVGRAGTILLTTDGRRFQRIPFPASADLVSVRATDARSATVVSSDGWTFTTADGGATWAMNPR